MAIRVRLLLAVACVAMTVVGCGAAATEDGKAAETTATVSTATPAPDATAKPADAAVTEEQQQRAQQLVEEAEKIMLDPALAPTDKYPKALGMFREALAIDPDNALAAQSITLIEDVYRSMGRPVPQPA